MRHLMPLLAAAASVLSPAPAYADLGDQLAKLLADDGAAFDIFGISVAISGATAIVGAYLNDDNGAESGSAYLFDTTTGRQIAKLLPDDGAADDRFGRSVAIRGATAIVEAFGDDDNGAWSGSAYLFDTTTGKQIAKLLPDDGAAGGGDRFGISVAIRGGTAIVGAYHDDDNGSLSGSAYLFDSAAPGKCPWDLDAGGSVGILDLLALLAAWGTNPGASRPTSTAMAPSASSTCSHCWPTGARAREEGSHEP
ncbi:MAG: FG-GAP repeat protein [Planctomycetota bacterium]|nr:FG-GAP repeat protein [Planctomycetota bacterium]